MRNPDDFSHFLTLVIVMDEEEQGFPETRWEIARREGKWKLDSPENDSYVKVSVLLQFRESLQPFPGRNLRKIRDIPISSRIPVTFPGRVLWSSSFNYTD